MKDIELILAALFFTNILGFAWVLGEVSILKQVKKETKDLLSISQNTYQKTFGNPFIDEKK